MCLQNLKTAFLSLMFLFLSISSFAQIPQLINYQGVLTDPTTGNKLNGTYSMTFSIYAPETGGTAIWIETQNVTVQNGLFSVLLGSVTPLPDDLFHETDRYLGVKVGTDAEMTPRKRLVSVGYSFNALHSDKLDGKDASSFVEAGQANAISTDMLQENAGTALNFQVRTTGTGDYYVSINGSDSNDGITPQTAWKTISHALNTVAGSEQHPVIIHVDAGKYAHSTNGEVFPLVLNGRSYISLQGAGSDSTILDTERQEETRAILFINSNNCSIDGFTFTGGSGSGLFPDNIGGIIKCQNSSQLIISSCKIIDNDAGGIWCFESSLIIRKNIISNNGVFDSGAGIRCSESSPEIIDNIIEGNIAAGSGGAIFCYQSNPLIKGNIIAENYCQSAFYEGGGAAIACFSSSPLIINNVITENIASLEPGNEGGGIYITSDSNPIIGGEADKGNCIYDNQGSGKGNDLYRQGTGAIINAQYNDFHADPTKFEVYPLDQFDLSHYIIPHVKRNHAPEIISFMPAEDTDILENDSLLLKVTVEDVDGDTLNYLWIDNQDTVSLTNSYLFIAEPIQNEFEIHEIYVFISDKDTTVDHFWKITVIKAKIWSFDNAKSLTIGNRFFYNSSWFPYSKTVVGQQIFDGKVYAIVKEDGSSGYETYERSDSCRLYEYDIYHHKEILVFDLDWEIGDTVKGNFIVSEKGMSNKFGFDRRYVKIERNESYMHEYTAESYIFMQTFGMIYHFINHYPSSYSYEEYYLEKAILDGTIFTGIEKHPDANIQNGNFELLQNYPNPFNSSTVISYHIPKKSKVTLKIFNLSGQLIKTLVDSDREPGVFKVIWDGKDDRGQIVSSGVYFCRLEANNFTKTNKLILIR